MTVDKCQANFLCVSLWRGGAPTVMGEMVDDKDSERSEMSTTRREMGRYVFC